MDHTSATVFARGTGGVNATGMTGRQEVEFIAARSATLTGFGRIRQ
jgi:hypothetical protein